MAASLESTSGLQRQSSRNPSNSKILRTPKRGEQYAESPSFNGQQPGFLRYAEQLRPFIRRREKEEDRRNQAGVAHLNRTGGLPQIVPPSWEPDAPLQNMRPKNNVL